MHVKGTAVAVLGAGCCPQDPGPLLCDPHIHMGVGVGAATPQGPARHSHQGRPGHSGLLKLPHFSGTYNLT